MPRPRSERRSPWPAVVLVVVLLPILYVLSIGPTARMATAEWISIDTWLTCYRPLLRPMLRVKTTRSAVYRYIDAWGAYPVTGRNDDGEITTVPIIW